MGLYSMACFLVYPLGIPLLFWYLLWIMKVPDIARDKKINAGVPSVRKNV
jgi:hypothetical protein